MSATRQKYLVARQRSPWRQGWSFFLAGLIAGVAGSATVLFIARADAPLGNARASVTEHRDGVVISAANCHDCAREAARPPGQTRHRVQLLRIVDGDTLRVRWHGDDTGVRLLGINAPERRDPGGKEATACLARLLAGAREIDLEFGGDSPARDSFGRLLAYVHRDGVMANAEMLRLGHAKLYRERKAGKYAALLKEAAGQ